MTTDKQDPALPPLPEPFGELDYQRPSGMWGRLEGYTATQMKAYGQASRKQTLTEVIAIGEAELEKYAGGDHSSGIRGSYERKTLNEYIAAIMELLK